MSGLLAAGFAVALEAALALLELGVDDAVVCVEAGLEGAGVAVGVVLGLGRRSRRPVINGLVVLLVPLVLARCAAALASVGFAFAQVSKSFFLSPV